MNSLLGFINRLGRFQTKVPVRDVEKEFDDSHAILGDVPIRLEQVAQPLWEAAGHG